MKLSSFIVELFELSGLNELEFCEKLNIDVAQFTDIKNGTAENSPGVKMLLKAVSASLFSKPKHDLDDVHDELTKARAIIVTVGESEGLAEHQQVSLSVASSMVDSSRQNLSEL